ncbi:MAG: hypothetical protein HOF57_03610 [Euryarchaeota archaeon]|nr:hypothetical protein [Euryarchaeota archaeon]
MGQKFPKVCDSCGEKILMVKNGSNWRAFSIPIFPRDNWRKHGIDCKISNDSSIPNVPLENKEPDGWPNDFELDGESVKDPGTWSGANIQQLTKYGIGHFLSNFDEYTGDNWNFDIWLAEINKRFIESCFSENLDGKENSRLLADRMFEVLKTSNLEGITRFQMLFAFYPDSFFEEMSTEISPKREFFDEIIYWAEQYDGEGLIGIYADVIYSMDNGDWKTASNLLIEEINSNDDAFTVNMLMNILCHTFTFFALEWGKSGVSPEYGLDSIDNIRSIVNTKLEWTP